MGQIDEKNVDKQDEQLLTEQELDQVAGGAYTTLNRKDPWADLMPSPPKPPGT